MSKHILFIDRDGTIIKGSPPTYQIDSFEKLEFYPGMFTWLSRIVKELDYILVMPTNQDGLGTESYPEEKFSRIQDFIMKHLENEGIIFQDVLVDKTFPEDQALTRKPNTGMFSAYIENPAYDLSRSFVIGDRITDVQLAKNLGCKAIWLKNEPGLGDAEIDEPKQSLESVIALETTEWEKIYEFLRLEHRMVIHERNTNETRIRVMMNLEGSGKTKISTGLHFLDHMLDQLGRHSGMDLEITVQGDLQVDEHHTVEDTAIALGETLFAALGNKAGIGRYGFMLPMDDCLAQVALDFGGRSWLVWDVEFKREKIGDVPTEMFFHFFKSFSDAAKCNLNIRAEGVNEHHKIESVFKALARAVKMAVKRDIGNMQLPTTKGVL